MSACIRLLLTSVLSVTLSAVQAEARNWAPPHEDVLEADISGYGIVRKMPTTEANLALQKDLRDRIASLPAEDAQLRADMITYHNELSPFYMAYIARSFLAAGDPDAAIEWYLHGQIRLLFDGLICIDTTSADARYFYAQNAPDVGAYIQNHPTRAGEILEKLVEDPKIIAGTATPLWICGVGVGRHPKDAPKDEFGRTLRLQPVDVWPGVYASVIESHRRMAARLQQSMDDPVSLDESIAARVETLADNQFSTTEAHWLDNKRAVWLGYEDKTPFVEIWTKGHGVSRAKIDGPIKELRCASNGNILIVTSLERYDRDTKEPGVVSYLHGRLEDLQSDQKTFLRRIEKPRHRWYGDDAYYQTDLRQSPFDCALIRAPKFLQDVPSAALWSDLGRGRGYLHTGREREGGDVGMFYYTDAGKGPLKLSDNPYGVFCLKDLPFRDAVLLTGCRDMGKSMPGARYRGEVPVVWLELEGDTPRIATTSLPLHPQESRMTQLFMTARGFVRLIPYRKTAIGDMAGGVYLYRTDRSMRKLWEGVTDAGDLSPDGCSLVFKGRPTVGASSNPLRYNIYALDLCVSIPESDD